MNMREIGLGVDSRLSDMSFVSTFSQSQSIFSFSLLRVTFGEKNASGNSSQYSVETFWENNLKNNEYIYN